jgi:hypothetical protein
LIISLLNRRRDLPVYDIDDAACVLTQFVRCICARKRIMERAIKLFHRIWDEEYSSYFYVSFQRGDTESPLTFWTKPKVFLTNEPLVLLTDEQKKLKRSPRLNRERIERD